MMALEPLEFLPGFEKVNRLWEGVVDIFVWHKQLFDANVLIERISFFIVPKIMVYISRMEMGQRVHFW